MSNKVTVIILAALTPVIFALYTNHIWEDWFITYRHSKNFASGSGLTYTPGTYVHGFTSPIGTLLPALITYLANLSDNTTIWVYRILSSCFFGFGVLTLMNFGRKNMASAFSLIFLVTMLTVDTKSIDFSINGMETAYLIFFLALGVFALYASTINRILTLAASFAGLMWTRPDGFIYIIGLLAGYFIFIFLKQPRIRKIEDFRQLIIASLFSAVLYVPWLAWAHNYYGSFIPHTVIAKGFSHSPDLDMIFRFLAFPILSLIQPLSFDQVFLPPYASGAGDWPPASHLISRVLSWIATFSFLIPGLNKITRALSFSVFIAQLYLNFGMPYIFPWYFPPVTVLSILVLALLLDQIINTSYSRSHICNVFRLPQLSRFFSSLIILFSLSLTILAAYQLKNQQQIIEDGHRKEIGLWLKDNAKSPADTVFVECSGYIGYFSNLDIHHYPGLTSPEFVAARKTLGTDSWPKLIRYLKSDWLVLRPTEEKYIQERDPDLLKTHYEIAKIFDVSNEIAKLPLIPGRYYLEYDQTFVVYRKRDSFI